MAGIEDPGDWVKVVERHFGPFARPIIVVVILALLVTGGLWVARNAHDNWAALFEPSPAVPSVSESGSPPKALPSTISQQGHQLQMPRTNVAPVRAAGQSGSQKNSESVTPPALTREEEEIACDPNNKDRSEALCDPNNRDGYAYKRDHQIDQPKLAPPCSVSSTGQSGGVTACTVGTVNQ